MKNVLACLVPLFFLSTSLIAENRFVDQNTHKENLKRLEAGSQEAIQFLRKRGTKETDKKRIEFSFASDDGDKARKLGLKLKEMGCIVSIDPYDGFSPRIKFFVKGSSMNIEMSDSKTKEWLKLAITTGYNHDCEYVLSAEPITWIQVAK